MDHCYRIILYQGLFCAVVHSHAHVFAKVKFALVPQSRCAVRLRYTPAQQREHAKAHRGSYVKSA